MITPLKNDDYFVDAALTSPLLSRHEKMCSDNNASLDVETAVITDENECKGKGSTREQDRYASRLELLDFCMQLTLMISIIHRDFFIHQTYTFVIILMYALALFWRNLPPFMSTNDGIEAQNDLTGMDQAKGNAKNGGCTNLICCIWGDFFMEHAGYIALIVWDLLFLMEEGDNISLNGGSFYLFQSEIALSFIILMWVVILNYRLLCFGKTE